MAKELNRACHVRFDEGALDGYGDFKHPQNYHTGCESETDGVVAIHIGSGRELPELLEYCGERHIPVIQASTGQTLPETVPVPVVDAPNLALPIVAAMKGVAKFWEVFLPLQGETTRSVLESHQATKTSVPGTAVKFAEAVGVSKEQIISERKPEVQEHLGVPARHIGRHGYHWIKIRCQGVDIEISTKVNGLEPYITGAFYLVGKVLERRSVLENRVYPVTYFFE
jgi:dihydrodipicolinate reductase